MKERVFVDNRTEFHEASNYRCLDYYEKQTENIYLRSCGLEKCVVGNEIHFQAGRPWYHLHVILSGKGYVTVNGQTHNLHFGQMFLTRPDEEVTYGPSAEDPWTYCWVSFDGANALSYVESAGFKSGVCWQDCFVDYQEFNTLVQRVLGRPELSLANDLMRLAALLDFLSLAIESNYKSNQVVRHRHEYAPDVYVNHALDYIRKNYDTIRVTDVARYIGINRSYLSNIFKKKMGVSPQEYLLQYRLDKGSKLLLETRMSIQEVAQKIGYDNPLTFSKMFKSVYGVSPRNYRLQGGGAGESGQETGKNSQ